ncbi:hypothetical protein L3Q82_025045 [Scortum barcoo]|uniref:Uncharacterized protein n=1 Tax=Scortum barcoo TaxID=214431 RepID=A0ACB8WRD1_9TELE|nr:hypothetical protein L3Q82_025045 [Scortum barcoo]
MRGVIMAPTEVDVGRQTDLIIQFLLEDEAELQCRTLDARLEPDGPTECGDDSFDPVQIADKLRTVADALNDDVSFRAVVTNLKTAAVQEAVDAAFSQGVEALCQSQVSQRAEVAPEMQLIKASVALGLYIKKLSPELKSKVQSAMASFLNRRVGSWVTQQGGWVSRFLNLFLIISITCTADY